MTQDDVDSGSGAPPDRPGRRRVRLGSIVIDTRPLRLPAFRSLWLSSAVTAIGGQFSTVAVPKQIYDLTGSSGYVGLTGAVGLVVLVVFGLWGGAIADAADRRTVMAISNLGLVVTTVLLWAQAAAGLDSVAVVLVLFGIQQSFAAVNAPTRSAAIARVVPPSQLVAANALGFTVFTFGAVFGPLVAGVLIPLTGLSTLYVIDSIGLTVALLMVLRLPKMPPGEQSTRTAGLRDVVDGLRYLGMHGVLMVSFLVDMIAMIAGMPKALFPEMAERTFGDPPGGGAGLGWLYAGIPLGAFAFGLVSGRLSRIRRNGVVVTFVVGIWGLAMAGFGLSHSLWLAVVFLAIGGAADMLSSVHRGAILQGAASDEMRGRIQGAFMVVVAGGPRLADVVHGWAAEAVGTRWAATGGGLVVIVLLVVTVALVPSFWKYEAPRD